MTKPFLLLILDGFGIREEKEYNAIAQAHTPTWQKIWGNAPHALLDASGSSVGLPQGQIGNSEVGHITIGAGRTIYQDLTRIDEAIANQSFAHHPIIQDTIKLAQDHPIHFFALLSPGGVHSHEHHLFATLQLFANAGCKKIYVHAFLDGRDVVPQSAKASLEKLMALCQKFPQIQLASMMGRYYAMDRDQRWERTQLAYEALTLGQTSEYATDPLKALEASYARGDTDEFVKPIWFNQAPPIENGDIVFFVNFRSDRARQLSRAFLSQNFSNFSRKKVPILSAFVSMTEYAKDIPSRIVFPPQNLKNALGEYFAARRLTQLRIAETEKYAHVTFFFSGGQEAPFEGETRILIPSPKISTYDVQPQMSVEAVTTKLVDSIEHKKFDFIVCNFANPDMVGHTGNFKATVQAIEAIDHCLALILTALQKVGGQMLITADHGNAECMFDEATHQPHTAHTLSLVPLVYVGKPATVLKETGTLADVAPTVLSLMALPIPQEMTGNVIFKTTASS